MCCVHGSGETQSSVWHWCYVKWSTKSRSGVASSQCCRPAAELCSADSCLVAADESQQWPAWWRCHSASVPSVSTTWVWSVCPLSTCVSVSLSVHLGWQCEWRWSCWYWDVISCYLTPPVHTSIVWCSLYWRWSRPLSMKQMASSVQR